MQWDKISLPIVLSSLRTRTVAILLVGRVITVLGAIQKRSYLYTLQVKKAIQNKVKLLRVTTFAITKMDER